MGTIRKVEIQRPPTMREEVFRTLRQAILTGEAPPGMKLIENKLAEELGTSRTPVREALHNLERENLIQSIPRVGYVVREITEAEVEEIIEIRVALETLAAKWAAQRITAREINGLERIVRLTEKQVQNDDTRGVADLDTAFHEIICKASRSQRILKMSQTLQDHMLRYRMMSLGVTSIARRANKGHQKILDAIKEADMRGIEGAIKTHMKQTKRDVIGKIF